MTSVRTQPLAVLRYMTTAAVWACSVVHVHGLAPTVVAFYNAEWQLWGSHFADTSLATAVLALGWSHPGPH